MARADADVIVVGAGPAGSATAMLLARRGYDVVLVDRARFPRPKPCGEYLNPSAVRALERLGVLRAAAAQGVTLSGMFIGAPSGEWAWAPYPAGRGLLVPRDRLDHTLFQAAAAAGARTLENFRVDAVEHGPRPTITGRSDGPAVKLRARLIVGADGMRSVVARRWGALPVPRNAHYTVGACFAGVEPGVPRGDLHLGRRCYAGVAGYGGGAANIVAAVPIWMFRRAPADLERFFHSTCATIPTLTPVLCGARRVSPFVAVGPLGYTRRPAVDDGVLLVGDAAGTIDPMTGEGIALALRGAELAAEAAAGALRTGDVSRRALCDYDRARARAFRSVWTVSRVLQWIMRHPGLGTHLARGLLRDPAAAGRLLGVVSQLRPVSDALSPRFLALVLGLARRT